MKKLLSMAFALFLLTSCSSDDSSPATPSIHGNPDPNTILVKKIVESYPTGFTRTSTYVYDGTRVTKILRSDGSFTDFIYNEYGLVKEVNDYAGGSLTFTKFFNYNVNNQLENYVMVIPGSNYSTRTVYTYNFDGTISGETFIGDFTSANQHFNNSLITKDINNNITSVVKTFESYTDNFQYTFDSKNSYDKNIAARDIIALAYENGGISNKLSYIYEVQDYMGTNEHENSTFAYTYNDQNYPIKSIESKANNAIITTEYFY